VQGGPHSDTSGVMAPLTFAVRTPGDLPGDLMLDMTRSAPGGRLILSEATAISIAGRGCVVRRNVCDDRRRLKRFSRDAPGVPHVLATLAVGRSSHVSMTNGAAPVAPIHRSARLARFHGPDGHAPRLGRSPRRIGRSIFQTFQALSRTIAKRAERRELPCETI